MLKNYKPYGELDLTEDGYLFEITGVQFASIIGELPSSIYILSKEDTDISNHVINCPILDVLVERLNGLHKFNKIDLRCKLDTMDGTIVFNKLTVEDYFREFSVTLSMNGIMFNAHLTGDIRDNTFVIVFGVANLNELI